MLFSVSFSNLPHSRFAENLGKYALELTSIIIWECHHYSPFNTFAKFLWQDSPGPFTQEICQFIQVFSVLKNSPLARLNANSSCTPEGGIIIGWEAGNWNE